MEPNSHNIKAITFDELPFPVRPSAPGPLRKTRVHNFTQKDSGIEASLNEGTLGAASSRLDLDPLNRKRAKAKTSCQDDAGKSAADEQDQQVVNNLHGRPPSRQTRNRFLVPHRALASVSKQSKNTVGNDDLREESGSRNAHSERALDTPYANHDPGLPSRESSMTLNSMSFWQKQANILNGKQSCRGRRFHTDSSLPPMGLLADEQDHQRVALPVVRTKTGNADVSDSGVVFGQQSSCSQPPQPVAPGTENCAPAHNFQGAVQPSACKATADSHTDDLKLDAVHGSVASTTISEAGLEDAETDAMLASQSSSLSSYRSFYRSFHAQRISSREAKTNGESLCPYYQGKCIDCGSSLADDANVKHCLVCGGQQVGAIDIYTSSSFRRGSRRRVPRVISTFREVAAWGKTTQ